MKARKENKDITRRSFVSKMAIIGAGCSMSLSVCGKKNAVENKEENTPLNITGLSLPSYLVIKKSGNLDITGKGFAVGDKIVFKDTSGKEFFTVAIASVTDNRATILLPATIWDGIFQISVTRGTKSKELGTSTIDIAVNTDIPDVAGATIKGTVHVGGVGLAGVVVSDGFDVASTNAQGVYYLKSEKRSGYVFVSIPGNYEVAADNTFPLFYKRLSQSANVVEVKDFGLTKVDNNEHVLFPIADLHLADRNNDLEQFQKGFIKDITAVIAAYKSQGKKVYGLTLGDMTWDVYWYENDYALPQYVKAISPLNVPIFNIMGNHDNDPYVANDWHAEDAFRKYIGPTYYSFNLGKIHYVVLDNIRYINTGGAKGVVGDRSYDAVIIQEQMDWLRKDLDLVGSATPVVVAMHAPLNRNPGLRADSSEASSFSLQNAEEFQNLLKRFSKVHVLSGHIHINYAYENCAALMEHNIAAVCATWWWTGKKGYAGNHICKDGSPGGYSIWEIHNDDMKWAYKSIGYDTDYQFRAYDLNTTQITAALFAPKSSDAELKPYAADYMKKNDNNEVLINVWGFDNKWDVSVFENGAVLPVTRVSAKDPLHIISYDALRLNVGATPTSEFVSANTSHFFKVKASAPDSTLIIKVTDRFGKVYQQTMIRPKTFGYAMV
ncbi:MAG: calcineurin-like phosphoesterase family protein [Niabella sp.]